MAVCNCSVGLSNTGTKCTPIADVAKKLIMVPLVASDGTVNEIPITQAIDDTYVDGKINETDPSKRWYVTPNLENVEDTRADNIVETLNSGANVFVTEGARTFTGIFVKESEVFLGNIKAGLCVDFGVFYIDKQGNLIGKISKDGLNLQPIAVDNDTWAPILVKGTDTLVQKVQLSFEYRRTELDEDLRMFTADEMTADMLAKSGLIDVKAVLSAITTTGFTATLTCVQGGTVKSPIPAQGWLVGDFTFNNDTDQAAIAITSVTEGLPGVYSFVFPAQDPADTFTLTGAKTGFELVPVSDVIP